MSADKGGHAGHDHPSGLLGNKSAHSNYFLTNNFKIIESLARNNNGMGWPAEFTPPRQHRLGKGAGRTQESSPFRRNT
jgi:hypothetical protein